MMGEFKMTTIYFIRHAEPIYNNHNDMERELTLKGLIDRELVTSYLSNKNIEILLSSPYKRSIDTIQHFADRVGLRISLIDNFKERRIDSVWVDDFNEFCKQQWNDFSYKLSDGETLKEVQERNIQALFEVLKTYKNKNIVIGSHGTALSLIINYFDNSFAYKEFQEIKSLFPWIVKFTFEESSLLSIEKINVHQL